MDETYLSELDTPQQSPTTGPPDPSLPPAVVVVPAAQLQRPHFLFRNLRGHSEEPPSDPLTPSGEGELLCVGNAWL